MKSIKDVYDDYKIPKNLQYHQYMVASLAEILYKNNRQFHPKNLIPLILASLLHDIGNIVKFDLENFNDQYNYKNLQNLKKIKETFIKKYSTDDKITRQMILEELGLFTQLEEFFTTGIFDETFVDKSTLVLRILKYSDLRIGPSGFVPIEDRINYLKVRYESHSNINNPKKLRNLITNSKLLKKEFGPYAVKLKLNTNIIEINSLKFRNICPIIHLNKTKALR